MFATRKWQQAALLLNLVGTVLLFYSFQATSSDFRLVTARSKSDPNGKAYALCVRDYALIVTDAKNGIILGTKGCPNLPDSRSVAVVNIEHPFFEGLGFMLLVFGFALQFFSIPQPQTVADFRRQLKLAKMKEKQISN